MKLGTGWQDKSLFILAKIDLGRPGDAPTPLVKKCCELTTKPLNKYSIENLRLMISQEIGLDFLIPIAITKLQADWLAEGDLYEGDLLSSVLNIDSTFWKMNAAYRSQLNELIADKEIL
jgi:hypothetical protein